MMMLATNGAKPRLVRVHEQLPLLTFNPKTSLTQGKIAVWNKDVERAGKAPWGPFVRMGRRP